MIDTFANFHVNVHDNICSPYLPSLRILRKETYLRYRVFLLYKHLSLRISSLFLFLLIVIAIYRVFRYISPLSTAKLGIVTYQNYYVFPGPCINSRLPCTFSTIAQFIFFRSHGLGIKIEHIFVNNFGLYFLRFMCPSMHL